MAVMCRCREVMRRREREVRLSPSMMAREIHRTQPVAPFFQSPMGPGAQPLCRAIGPSIPYPACKTSIISTTALQPCALARTGPVASQTQAIVELLYIGYCPCGSGERKGGGGEGEEGGMGERGCDAY